MKILSGNRRMMLQIGSLLYTIFFFVQPHEQATVRGWITFSLFYAVFLSLYFSIPVAKGKLQPFLWLCFCALAFFYYPFNSGAAEVLVFPIVLAVFLVRTNLQFFGIFAVYCLLILLETYVLHLSLVSARRAIYFAAVIGISNLSFVQEQRANDELRAAQEEREYLATLAERERIARDLHDLLGHTLTVVAMQLSVAKRLICKDAARATIEVDKAQHMARQALTEVRQAVEGYTCGGLVGEMQQARDVLQTAGIALEVIVQPVALRRAHDEALTLIVREAVTNVIRHSRATKCEIELKCCCGKIMCSISDDGVGGASIEGSGLRSMKHRALSAGGRLAVISSEREGTIVRVLIEDEVPS